MSKIQGDLRGKTPVFLILLDLPLDNRQKTIRIYLDTKFKLKKAVWSEESLVQPFVFISLFSKLYINRKCLVNKYIYTHTYICKVK